MLPKRPKYRLSKLTLEEISLVDRGANPGARVAFWKGNPMPPVETLVSIAKSDPTRFAANTYEDALSALAKRRQAETGEIYEVARAHVEFSTEDGHALRLAKHASGRAPHRPRPVPVDAGYRDSAAEDALTKMIYADQAAAPGRTLEQATARVLKTDRGRELSRLMTAV